MSKHEPLYIDEHAEQVGLDGELWDVAIDKQKGSGGRKVIVWVRNKKTDKVLVDAKSGQLTKEGLDRYAKKLAIELADRLTNHE